MLAVTSAPMARDRRIPAGRRVRAIASLLAVSSAAYLALALGPGVSAANARCAHAGAPPHQVSLSKMRKATICLINKERASRGRHVLDSNARLQLAAERHTKRMLATDCLRHKCPGEPGLNRRVRRTGYTKGQKAWRFAEDLGYDNTPRQMIKAWLHSSFNRRILLNRHWRDVGVGVGWGAAAEGADDSRFATYTAVFGWRRAK
jgi:uncharacterized protein YkwD